MSLNLCRATILTFVRQSLMFCFATSSMLTNEKSVLKHNSGNIGANSASKLAFPNMVKRLISFFNDVSSHLYNSYVINIVDAPEIAESFLFVAGCGVPRTLDNADNRI
eukprot:scaffold19573_cov80-Cylindrotheca_fusiformis.AAC.1